MAQRRDKPINSKLSPAQKEQDATISGDWTFTGTVDLSGTASFDDLRVYDSSDTDFVKFSHDGTDLNVDFTTTDSVNWNALSGGSYKFNDDILIRSGKKLRILNSDNTEYMDLSHDGTTGIINVGSADGLLLQATARANVLMQTISLDDDASGTFTWPAGNGGIAFVLCSSGSSIVEGASTILFQQGTGVMTAIWAGSSTAHGTANPDTDTVTNYYCDSASTLGIKNREGGTRIYTAYMFTGD